MITAPIDNVTSPFGNMFLKLINRLNEKAPSVRYIEQDLGQMENYDIRPPVSFPCVLLDFDDQEWSEAGELEQLGEGILCVRIAQPAWSPSNNLAPEDIRKMALSYYETEQEVHLALHGWCTDNFRKMIRVSNKKEKRTDEYRVRVVRYRFGMEDDSGNIVTTIPRPGITFNLAVD